MIVFSELLKNRGFDLNCSYKIVRHKPSVEKLIDNNLFEQYQSIQEKDVFECDYIISFIGKESTKALFLGIYKIIGKMEANKANITEEYKKEFSGDDLNIRHYYVMEKQKGFEDLEERIIIDWGDGTRSWVQNNCDKVIIEIKPYGFVEDFSGYLDFVISFKKLEKIINFSDANNIWKNKLSSVSGIYLILDKNTGLQYIGSACGDNGIWGRWEDYIKTGHGGDVMLIKLLENTEKYKYNFQFTILQTLPSNLTKAEVNKYENLYKEKLGSKTFGLNKN